MTTIPHKINLITAISIGAIIGHQGWWLAATALAVAIWWRGE